MLVATAFDLWQRDDFFSAAEEVQESADILESTYRTWLREKREGLTPVDLDEIYRELETALGTAKWQLEEFERAIRLSYGNCRDENRIARHQQFVLAIGSQISRVENGLRESLSEVGKQPFRWINLDEEERDDLAMFLSGAPRTLQASTNLQKDNLLKRKDVYFNMSSSRNSTEVCSLPDRLKDDVTIDMDDLPHPELSPTTVLRQEDTATSTKRSRGSVNFTALRIVVPDEDEARETTLQCIDATPKPKGSRTSSSIYLKGVNWINQIFRCSNGFTITVQTQRHLQFRHFARVMIVFTLLVLLFVTVVIRSR